MPSFAPPKALAGAAVVAVTLAACASAPPPRTVEASVDLVIPPIGRKTAPSKKATGILPSSGQCTLRLAALPIQKSSPACFVDEQISRGPGILSYPCGGEGPTIADFADHRYVGTISHGDVELELVTELDWDDGCHWGSRATIAGTLSPASAPSTRATLVWTYVDRVLSGSGCSGVCQAKTFINVSPTMTRKPNDRTPTLDDDDED